MKETGIEFTDIYIYIYIYIVFFHYVLLCFAMLDLAKNIAEILFCMYIPSRMYDPPPKHILAQS